ncbi:MAG TPA: hypothetical protein VEQ36_13675 [Thermomicrobiales bacterium]|nr:hypothetical protein [Thermomicrobiales bacterium]
MDQSRAVRIDEYVDDVTSPVVREILMHLCEMENPSYGSIIEWCETRGDCAQAVVCPECGVQYLLDDDEMAELRVISARTGEILSCGVIWD